MFTIWYWGKKDGDGRVMITLKSKGHERLVNLSLAISLVPLETQGREHLRKSKNEKDINSRVSTRKTVGKLFPNATTKNQPKRRGYLFCITSTDD